MRLGISIACFLLLGACLEHPADEADGGPDARPPRDVQVGQDRALQRDAATTYCTADDLVEQQMCGAGDKCTLINASSDVGCAPAGVTAAYASCATSNPADRPDECSIGTLCADARGDGSYKCLPFCLALDTFCEGGVCAVVLALSGSRTAYLCRPADGCDVLTAAGCDGGDACYLVPVGEDLTFCSPPGTLGEGAPCNDDFACQAAHICFGAPGEERCRRVCRPATGEGCLADQLCGDLSENYGVCWDQ